METVELWRTIVGSHVWKANHPGSDTDYFACYAVDTNSILRGEVEGGGAHFSAGGKGGVDVQNHEIGKWVNECLKGNFNYMVGVFSPLVVTERMGYLTEFRAICRKGMAKNMYPSLNGMVRHNLTLYRKEGIDGWEKQKKLNGCARSLRFGIAWMRDGEIAFEPASETTETMVFDLLEEFKRETEASEFPDKPENGEEYRQFLYKVRMERLKQ